jgi:hypothetical protein
VEFFNKTLAEFASSLSSSWVMFDPFRYCWEQGRKADGVHYLDGDMSILGRDLDWLNSVVLLERSSARVDALFDLFVPSAPEMPSWTLRYDFFLGNCSKFLEISSMAIFPNIWIPDGVGGGNAVVLCSSPAQIRPVISFAAVTPIQPAAVLRNWPDSMLEYMATGIGLTGGSARR